MSDETVSPEPSTATQPEAVPPTTAPETKPTQETDQAAKRAEQLKAANFAKLERLKAKIAADENRIKAERAELTRQAEEAKRVRDELAQIRQNPIKMMEMTGLTLQQLNEAVLNNGRPGPDLQIANLATELESLRKQQQELLSRAEAAENAQKEIQAQAVINQFVSEMNATIKNSGEKYELINTLGKTDMVYQLIREHAAETQEILPVDEAAAMIESQLEKEFEPLLKTKKFGGRIQPQATPNQSSDVNSPSAAPTEKKLSQGEDREARRLRAMALLEKKEREAANTPTLSSTMAASSLTSPRAQDRVERRARAMAVADRVFRTS